MYSPKRGYGTLSEEDAEPTLPSDILYRRAHRYGLWLLESISNNYRIEEAVSEYRHALEGSVWRYWLRWLVPNPANERFEEMMAAGRQLERSLLGDHPKPA